MSCLESTLYTAKTGHLITSYNRRSSQKTVRTLRLFTKNKQIKEQNVFINLNLEIFYIKYNCLAALGDYFTYLSLNLLNLGDIICQWNKSVVRLV